MSTYLDVITKQIKPGLQSLADDLKARRDPKFFPATGTQVYCGRQGSGKTISAVKHVIDLKTKYPFAIVVSNLDLKDYKQLNFNTKEQLAILVDFMRQNDSDGVVNSTNSYIHFSNIEQLIMALERVNNEYNGVVYLVDEIHTYFNALESKNVPMSIFTEISQQRKQRKLIVGTSQLFLRMAKPFREQCDNLIMCKTYLGFFTLQKAYDGMELSTDNDGNITAVKKRVGWFYHDRKIRKAFDTYQKVVSQISVEFEQPYLVVEQPKKVGIFSKPKTV